MIRAAIIGNAAEDGSAGTTIGCGTSSGWPVSVMRRPLPPSGSTRTCSAEMGQHLFGMVARRLGFDHDGFARRGKAGEQRRRLQLRRRHRRPEHNRDRIARPGERQRQPAVGRGERARADTFQGIEDAAHRPLAQRRIAVERRRHRAAGDCAQHEPAAGSRIAEVERCGRLGKAADADAAQKPSPLAGPLDMGAQCAERLCRIDDVLAFEQAADPGLADRERAEDQGANRDRLVAGHARPAGQGAVTAGGERSGVGGHSV